MKSLTLTKKQLKEMISYVDMYAPREACGLLAGHNSKVQSVIKVTNQAQSTVRYVMEPIEQLKAFEWMESQGQDLIGIFHSHPAGPETVSPTDIAEATYEVVHVILARVDGLWRARGFWIKNGTFTEVPLHIS